MLELNTPGGFANEDPSVIDFSHLDYSQNDSGLVSIGISNNKYHPAPKLISVTPLPRGSKKSSADKHKNHTTNKTASEKSKTNDTKSKLSYLFPKENDETLDLLANKSKRAKNAHAHAQPFPCTIDDFEFDFNNNFTADINSSSGLGIPNNNFSGNTITSDASVYNNFSSMYNVPSNSNNNNSDSHQNFGALNPDFFLEKHGNMASGPFSPASMGVATPVSNMMASINSNEVNSSYPENVAIYNNNQKNFNSFPPASEAFGAALYPPIDDGFNQPMNKGTNIASRFGPLEEAEAEDEDEDDEDNLELVSIDQSIAHHAAGSKQAHINFDFDFNSGSQGSTKLNSSSSSSLDEETESFQHQQQQQQKQQQPPHNYFSEDYENNENEFAHGAKAIPIMRSQEQLINDAYFAGVNGALVQNNHSSNSYRFSATDSEASMSYQNSFQYSSPSVHAASVTPPNVITMTKMENDVNAAVPLSDELAYHCSEATAADDDRASGHASQASPIAVETNPRKRYPQNHSPVVEQPNSMSKRSKTIAMDCSGYFNPASYTARQLSSSAPSTNSMAYIKPEIQSSHSFAFDELSHQFLQQQQQQQQLPASSRNNIVKFENSFSNVLPVKRKASVLLNIKPVVGSKQLRHSSAASTPTTSTIAKANYPPFQETVIDFSSTMQYTARPMPQVSRLSGDFKTSSKNSKTILSEGVSITRLSGNSNGAIMTKAKLCNIGIKKNVSPTTFVCNYCSASFKVKGYLSRHLKKHSALKAFVCPFFKSDSDEVDVGSFNAQGMPDKSSKTEDRKLHLIGTKCHPSGGFSRRDTYKTHLKALHFIYPAGTKSTERNDIGGSCAGCFEFFENNNVWLEEHIEKCQCKVMVNKNIQEGSVSSDSATADSADEKESLSNEENAAKDS